MDGNKLAKTITKAGILLVENGAETVRVEDTMQRIAKAYGASVADAYATPTLLIVSISMPNSTDLFHNIKRVHMKSVNLDKIDKVNTLSRSIISKQISLDDLDKKLDELAMVPNYPDHIVILGAAICVFGFNFFFQGDIHDALFAMIVGIIAKYISILLEKIELSSFFVNAVGGAIISLLAVIFARYFGCDQDIVIISSIMLLVPGLAITNGIRDSVSGDLVSGLVRATEAIFIAIAIAIGSGIMLALLGGF
ncbi:MAG: threonine/serine exporter family protein [Erysipelotrichaceae bacterium]|nr:threonine/serine exporter family protein [Erysipelotrichaceae bacterium]MDY5251673.1 threonine/serine exporter family protein [Erysipelotrichaceae bacterium]